MSLARAYRFLRTVLVVVLAIAIIAAGLVAVELIAHPFGKYIDAVQSWISRTNQLIDANLMSGLSFGMIALVLIVALIPLTMRTVNRSQYVVATQRGIIAALVFFATQLFYNWAESYNRFYLIVAMVAVILVTFVMVETLSLLMRKNEEVAFRTDLLASFASGMVSGIVIKLIMVAFSL